MSFLGVDCGGTKSRWAWLATESDAEGPAETLAVPVQPAVQGVEVAGRELGRVLAAAVEDARGRYEPVAVVAAVAGVGDRAGSDALAAACSTELPLAVVGDVLAAATGALGTEPGLLVWAGTGSFAIARDTQGQLPRVGGRGYLLGDQGSGFDLVRRAAAAAVMAVDGLAEETQLGRALSEAFDVSGPERLGAAMQQLDSGSVASRLPVLLECAARGDMVASMVLEEGMDGLAMLANAAVRQAELDWPGLPVTLGGGLLTGFEGVTALLRQRLAGMGAAEPAMADPLLAARGAARLAQAWHKDERPMADWVGDVSL